MGFDPAFEGFKINPQLPNDWPSLTITRVKFHDTVLELSATKNKIKIEVIEPSKKKLKIFLPEGKWKVNYKNTERKIVDSKIVLGKNVDKGILLQIGNSRFVEMEKI